MFPIHTIQHTTQTLFQHSNLSKVNMLASSAIVVGLLAAFSGFAAASPVPQANSLPGSTDEVCFPCAADFDTYIQAFNSSNRLVVGDNAREASPVTSLAGGQTKWRIERTGSEPNEGVIK